MPASITLDREGIAATLDLIRPHIRRTPVVESGGADFGLDASIRLTFKLEMLQHGGSFKARGAFANLLLRPVPAAGVVAASGGNHGVAVSFAAKQRGVPAKIFLPSTTTPVKIDQVKQYGADLVVAGDRYDDALAASQRWAAESGAMPIHAYDQLETILGQGTTGAEFEEQAPDLETILVSVGGGGFIGGIATWYAGRDGGMLRLVGVEPELAPTLTRALAAGEPVDTEGGGIAAGSLAPKRVGRLMFPIAQRHVDRVLLVTDEAILAAQVALWRVLRVVAEPGGAAAFAALLSGRYRPRSGERIGIVICGGNTTAVSFEG